MRKSTFKREDWRQARAACGKFMPTLKRALLHGLVIKVGRNAYRWGPAA